MDAARRVGDAVMRRLAEAPTEPCLWWRGEWWARGVLAEIAEESREALASGGFTSGHRLALVLPNSPASLALCIAVWSLGGSVVPVSASMARRGIGGFMRDAGLFGAIVGSIGSEQTAVLRGADIPFAQVGLGDSCPVLEGRADAPPARDGEAALFHTAGASGRVRPVSIAHTQMLTLIDAIEAGSGGLDEDDVICDVVAYHHAFGFVGAMVPLVLGYPQVVLPGVRPPGSVARALRQSGATVLMAVPNILRVMLADDDLAPFTKIRMVFYGGAELAEGDARRAREIFGSDPLAGYGLTEAAGALAVTPFGGARAGSCGRLLPCFEAVVRGANGDELPRGEAGRLHARWRGGDWFDTGDTVRVDDDGYIYILARKRDRV